MAEPTGTARQVDFFLAAADDPPLRDNRDAMEYPFLALQKRRIKPITFKGERASIFVTAPLPFSIATIWDWDVIIGISAQINEAIGQKLPVTQRIRFVPHQLLRVIGRTTSGREYRNLAQALRRLAATLVITDIREEDQPESGELGFHWLNGFWIPKRYSSRAMTPAAPEGEPDPARPWEVEL